MSIATRMLAIVRAVLRGGLKTVMGPRLVHDARRVGIRATRDYHTVLLAARGRWRQQLVYQLVLLAPRENMPCQPILLNVPHVPQAGIRMRRAPHAAWSVPQACTELQFRPPPAALPARVDDMELPQGLLRVLVLAFVRQGHGQERGEHRVQRVSPASTSVTLQLVHPITMLRVIV